MGQILIGTADYNSIRMVLGLEKDAARLLTDEVIEAYPHLPLAEAELFDRSPAGVPTLLNLEPNNYKRGALKAACVALTCAFLCRRLQVTLPIRQKIELGEVERQDLDWEVRRAAFISDMNWAWSLTGLDGKGFPRAMDHAQGALYTFDPKVYSLIHGGSDLSGYTSPFSGYVYAVSLTI